MYPFVRLIYHMARTPAGDLGPLDTHVSHHICWPWDLDMWMELNNGRTLTLYDLGRIPLAKRAGLLDTLKAERWGLTVAGSSVRYRKRVRAFDRVEMRSRLVGWDARFVYIDQSMWRPDGSCTSQGLFRTAVTDANGIVTPDRVLAALGRSDVSPTLPDWVRTWAEAEGTRPWPPDRG